MKAVITNNGLTLMNQTPADGLAQYWIGYYGLAYVPDENRVSQDNSEPLDPIRANMNELTRVIDERTGERSGDDIYNVLQGAMTPAGVDTDIGESAAAKLYNECMYTGSVIGKYRYVLDENGNNKLLVFESVNESGSPVEGSDAPYGLQVYQEYNGVSSTAGSALPIPAPLYYRGEPRPWDTATGADDNVSADTRLIHASASWADRDIYSWNSSKDFTYGLPADHYVTLDSFEKLQSVSNFNRFHAPARFDGYAVDYEPASRNMAMATKLFPIAHYDVKCSKDDEHVKEVSYKVDIDLDSVFSKISRRSYVYYEDGRKLDPVTDKDTLASYQLGFKFNRIGLYAVRVTLQPLETNNEHNKCDGYSVQMQINGNEPPVLFAVMDLPSPIILSENGVHRYTASFQVNVSNFADVVDLSSIYYNLYENDAITWYKNQLIANASSAEAVTTLGVQLNYLRQQIADLTNSTVVCGVGDSGDNFHNEVITNGGLKNLVDSIHDGNGSVRGINTMLEGSNPVVVTRSDDSILLSAPNKMGDNSLGLGKDSATLGDLSLNMSDNGIIGPDAAKIFLLGGCEDNEHIVVNDSTDSIVVASETTEVEKLHNSILIGERSSVGSLDLLGALQTDEALKSDRTYEKIFGNVMNGSVTSVSAIGSNNTIGRCVQHTLGLGESSNIANNTNNVLLIGSHINDQLAQANPPKIFTVDEFNEKYATAHVAADDPYFVGNTNHLAIVVGDGEIHGLNGDNSQFTYNSKGITLYIHYNNDAWHVPSIDQSTVDAFQKPGHDIKNLFMIGDYNSVGYDSYNSIILGDNTVKKNIAYQNSFITNAGSETPIPTHPENDNIPRTIFNNVWWIGHIYADSTPYDENLRVSGDQYQFENSGHFLTNRTKSNVVSEVSDIFAFVGRNNRQFAYADWYGINTGRMEDTIQYRAPLLDYYSNEDVYQPCKSPMIYSGGIALGGYGTSDSDFMLLKIGMRGCWYTDTGAGISTGLHHPNMWTPNLNLVKDIVYLTNDEPWEGKERTVVNSDGKFTLYDNYCSDGIHHLQVESPYAGMVLMVQDKQELDGTLHVGLGSASMNTYGMRTVKLVSKYVESTKTMIFSVETATETDRSIEELSFDVPVWRPGEQHTEGEHVQDTKITSDGRVKISVNFTYHINANISGNCQVTFDPQNRPLNAILSQHNTMTGLLLTDDDNSIEVLGMYNAGQMVMVSIGDNWAWNKTTLSGDSYYTVMHPVLNTDTYDNNTNTSKLGVDRGKFDIPVSGNQYTTYLLNSVSIPGYYAADGYNNCGVMKVDHAYMNRNAGSYTDNMLPYIGMNAPYSCTNVVGYH